MKLIIVTGLSGSGKSIALHTLEDQGYYCIDNLPLFLLERLAKELQEKERSIYRRVAVGIDARNPPDDLQRVPRLVEGLRRHGVDCEILFLEAQDDTMIKRFSETRRKHPLTDEERPLAEAIHLEHQLLDPLLNLADLRIDTTHTTQHELRETIRSRLSEHVLAEISLQFQSFGYKHGVPRDADFVYDVRCLPNPYWNRELRPLNGKNLKVAAFLEQEPLVQQLKEEIIAFLERWVPTFEADGRSYLTIACGCTGGQHRSVYLVEQLSEHFHHCGRQVLTCHRELP